MLYSVNLLPWRDEKRKKHKKRFFSLIVLSLLVSFLLQYVAGWYFIAELNQQQGRINYFTRYIEQLDQKINELKLTEQDHSALLIRLSVVEELQSSRNRSTEFMVEIQKLVPEGVYVDKIKMKGNEIEMKGISDSTAHLATMLDNLEKSAFLEDVSMHSIIHDQKRFGQSYQTFEASFRIAVTDERPLDDGISQMRPSSKTLSGQIPSEKIADKERRRAMCLAILNVHHCVEELDGMGVLHG
ncbi:PilN domain-containing protein [Vibrio genomosp. F10]|uniref:PilN domain-containing protein n=1 Tax=Vibrio genomosp. F10 TaxID=723171 RepID=UPI0003140C1F|nr:PilN domain-containing protein [Vibrio genomosp. F10]OEE86554.1 pilus assembly protein PilN [Vibrio genomosp. F10 str. 9ZD137]